MRLQIERRKVTEIEFKWAIEQLAAVGLLERGQDDTFCLSNEGINRCVAMEWGFSMETSILLLLYYNAIGRLEKDEQGS
jgi:hypothetical protein